MKRLMCAFICIIVLLTSFVCPAYATDFPLSIFNNPGSYPIDFGDAKPLVNGAGRTLIPASSIDNVFQGGISYVIEDDTITITQNGFEYITIVKITVGSNILYKNDTEIEIDTTPSYINDQIYIPLRAVGEVLEHFVYWNERLNEIDVTYDSVEIYMWNENQDSSDSGLRYAMFQGSLKQKEISEIQERAVSDFGEIEGLFDRVPKGKIHLCVLYKINGNKVSYEKEESTEREIIDRFGYACGVSERLIDEVPPIVQGTGDYSDKWYSEQLMALGESSLRDNTNQTYRFTCIRSFHAPFTIKIDVLADGTGTLSFAMCEQPIGSSGGEITKTAKKELSKEQIDTLLQSIDKKDFWNLPTSIDNLGLDGSEWIVEGVNIGRYHIVERWSPDEGTIYELGKLFIELSGEEIKDLY